MTQKGRLSRYISLFALLLVSCRKYRLRWTWPLSSVLHREYASMVVASQRARSCYDWNLASWKWFQMSGFLMQDVADSCRTGAATNIIFGLALGYKSAIVPCFVIAIAIYVAFSLANMFGIACAALGMLNTLATGIYLTILPLRFLQVACQGLQDCTYSLTISEVRVISQKSFMVLVFVGFHMHIFYLQETQMWSPNLFSLRKWLQQSPNAWH